MKSDGFIIPAGRCELCPRRCAAARFGGGALGWCGAADAPRVFRWGPHFGEEPPLVEGGGSGCVFFSRCTMKCLYCQNSPWSWKGGGKDKTVAELTEIFRVLAVEDKCANWNLVSPTPYLPFIREAVAPLLAEGIRLPFVWNSSGYERVETLEEYSDLCDWALFDLRYSRDETAVSLSQAPGYVAASRAAVKWAWNKQSNNLTTVSSCGYWCCRDTPTRRLRTSRGSRRRSRMRCRSP